MFQVSMIKVSNIKSIFTWDVDQNKLVNFDNHFIYLDKDKIYKITSENLPFDQEIDAENAIITPGFIDCHTHPIFSSNRAIEFNLRSSGATYAEIASKGGGLISAKGKGPFRARSRKREEEEEETERIFSEQCGGRATRGGERKGAHLQKNVRSGLVERLGSAAAGRRRRGGNYSYRR